MRQSSRNSNFETRSISARKAWRTRQSAPYKASKSEKESKRALQNWCREHGWKLLFFEGDSGAPRTGIVDALIARISASDVDSVEIRFIQLKSGASGLSAGETARLKQSLKKAKIDWIATLFDGRLLHFLPEIPSSNTRFR